MKHLFGAKLEHIEQLLIHGDYKSALAQIDEIYEDENLSIEEKIKCNILRAETYLNIFPYLKGIEYAEEAYAESKEIDNKLLMFDSIHLLPRPYLLAGDIASSKEKKDLSFSILDSFEDKESVDYRGREALLSVLHAERYYMSIPDIERSLATAKELGLAKLEADSYISLGSKHLWSGNLNTALAYAQTALALCQNLDYFVGTAMLYNQMAVIYLQKGELEHSKKQLLLGLEMCAPDKMNGFYEACLLINLGIICWFKRDSENALDYFSKAAILLKKAEVVKTYHYPVSLSRISTVLIEQGRLEEASNIIQEIENLYLSSNKHIIKKILHLTKAIYLKSRNQELDVNEAIILLEEFADDPIAYLDLNIWIVFHLCDLYLKKVTEYKDTESYEKLKYRINTLKQMAEHDKSYVLIAQSLLLQSKLELIEFHMEKGEFLLQKALNLAEDKGISNLARIISREYDNLLDQLSKWDEMSSYIPNLEERFEFSHIEELLELMIRNNALYDQSQDEQEQPFFFMIMNRGGSVIFSEKFTEAHLDANLLGELQNVIRENTCSDSFFGDKITRMRFQQYTIVIRLQEEMFLIYVFIGHSYSAIQKLRSLEEEIRSLVQEWSKYYRENQQNLELSLHERMKLSKTLELSF